MFQMDSDSDIENVSSQPGPPEVFDIVPREILFKFKLFSYRRHILEKFKFVLKAGKTLPYRVSLKGTLCLELHFFNPIEITFTIVLYGGARFKK